MRKGIQPALEQYLVTAGGGEGAAVVAAAAAASMDKRALLASPGFPAAAAAPSAYIQILTTNTSTTSCSSSLQSGAVAAGPLLPSAPGVEQTAGSLIYTTPHGPSGRAGLLQQPPALGRGGSGGGGPPVNALPSPPSPARAGGGLASRGVVGALRAALGGERGAERLGLPRLPLQRGFIVKDSCVAPRQRPEGRGAPPRARGGGDRLGANHIKHSETFRGSPYSSFPALFPTPTLPSPPTRSFLFLGRRKGSRPGWRRGWRRE